MNRLVIVTSALCVLPLVTMANHHGTRCPIGFYKYKKEIIKPALKNNITEQQIDKAITANAKYLKKLGTKRRDYKEIPSIALVYSIPLSFTTCQIKLYNKHCPALQWCYPFKYNKNTATCGKINVPLTCSNERKRCQENPKRPECVKPPAAQERCYANPKLPGCKKLGIDR